MPAVAHSTIQKNYLLMESYYFLVLQQLRRITASQVKEFLVLCREKYMRAKSEPGTKLNFLDLQKKEPWFIENNNKIHVLQEPLAWIY